MDIKKLITEYLEEATLMQVATAKDNQPWVCSVYFAFDNDFTIYWISQPSRRHSEELRNNEKVAGAIVKPHTPGQDVRGIQFEGIAKELSEKEEVEKGAKIYAKRFGMSDERVRNIMNNTDGHLVYEVKPRIIVLFDEVNFPNNPRQEYKV